MELAQKQKFLQDHGFDPAAYDLGDDGSVVERQAQVQPNPSSLVRSKSTATEAFLHGAERNIGSGLGAAAGTAAGMAGLNMAATSWLGGPITGIPGTLAGLAVGLGGGYGGSWLGGKVQQALTPADVERQQQEQAAVESKEHPIASFAGEMAPGLSPFKANVKAAQGLSKLARIQGVTLSEAEKVALMNAAANAGMGAGFEAAGQGMSDQPMDPTKIAIAAAAQGVMSEPNPLGQKMGFHGTPAEPKFENMENRGAAEKRLTAEDQDRLIAEGAAAARSSYEAQVEPVKARRRPTSERYEVDPLLSQADPEALIKEGYTKAKAAAVVTEPATPQPEAKPVEPVSPVSSSQPGSPALPSVAPKVEAAPAPAPAPVEQHPEVVAKTAEVQKLKAINDLTEAQIAEQRRNDELTAELNAAYEKKAAKQRAAGLTTGATPTELNPAKPIAAEPVVTPNPVQKPLSAVKPKITKEAIKKSQEKYTNPLGDKYMSVEDFKALSADEKDMTAPALAKQIAAERGVSQQVGEALVSKHYGYEGFEFQPAAGAAPKLSNAEAQRANQLAQRRGLPKLQWIKDIVTPAGESARGRVNTGTGQIDLSLAHATNDTPYHEIAHPWIKDRMDDPRVRRALEAQGWDGKPETLPAAEEKLVQRLGEEAFNRGKNKSFWKDLKDHVVNRLGLGSEESQQRQLAAKMTEDAPETHTSGSTDVKYQPIDRLKEAFKDSKVVDENGNPKVLHSYGTKVSQFEELNPHTSDNIGEHFFSKENLNKRLPNPESGDSIISKAGYHTAIEHKGSYGEPDVTEGENLHVKSGYLNIKNPYETEGGFFNSPERAIRFLEHSGIITAVDRSRLNRTFSGQATKQSWKLIREKLSNAGYDGIKYPASSIVDVGDNWVPFTSEQFKHQFNSGNFNPEDKRFMYQEVDKDGPDSEGPADVDTNHRTIPFLASTVDRLRKKYPNIADSVDKFYGSKNEYIGRFGNDVRAQLSEFPKSEVDDTIKQHYDIYHGDMKPEDFSGNDKISEILKNWATSTADEQRKVGLKINDRARGKNEYYIPAMMNIETLAKFTNPKLEHEMSGAKADWQAYLENKGMKPDEAAQHIDDFISAVNSDKTNYRSINFGALRKAAGMGLPEAMRESSGDDLIRRYGQRYAADLSFFKHIEQPHAEELGLNGHRPTPATTNRDVKDSMRWMLNNFESAKSIGQERLGALMHATAQPVMGVGTGLRDAASIPANSLPYMGPVDFLNSAVKAVANWREHSLGSLKTNARQFNNDKFAWGDYETPDKVTDRILKLGNLLRMASGREAIERFNRTLTYGIGAEYAKAKLISGDDAFFKRFGLNTEGKEGEELVAQTAKNFTDAVQGSYDGRGLPAWVQDSKLQPFFALSKWSIEKANTINRDVIEPMRRGEDFKPFLRYTLGSLLTGAGIQELNKALRGGKKDTEASLKEAQVSGTAADMAHSVIHLAQLGGYAGIISDLAQATSSAVVKGKTPSAMSFPLADAFQHGLLDGVANFRAAVRNGEDPAVAARELVIQFVENHVQNVSYLSKWMDPEKVKQQNEKRDLTTYEELSGNQNPSTFSGGSNPAVNPAEKKFAETQDLHEAASLLPEIVNKLIAKFGNNPEKLREKINSLGSSQASFPDPDKTPITANLYYQHLSKVFGPEEAKNRLLEYYKEAAVKGVKKDMVPRI